MKKVEKPTGTTADDGLDNGARQGGSIMLDPDGNYVIVNPDTASWEKAEAKMKASAARAEEAELTGSKELQELGLECPIDKRLFVEPVKTPCCAKTYCYDCIENALVDNDLICPNCGTTDIILDNLKSDDETVAKIQKYEDDKAAEKKIKEQAAKSPKGEAPLSPPAETNASPKASSKSKSPSPASSKDGPAEGKAATPEANTTSKKRPAEEELKNERSPPKAPAAMLRQQNQNQPQQPQIVPPGFDKKFIDAMNQYAPPNAGNQQFPIFPQGMNAMNGMNSMGMPNQNGMMGMPMTMPQMMGMPGAMINPMMMPNQGGYPSMGPAMNGMGFPQQNGGYGNFNNNGMMHNGAYGGHGFQGGNQGWQVPQQQQQMLMQMQNGNFGNFPNGQPPSGPQEENAYMRKAVNPHRAQNRQRRAARGNDYSTL
jgi:protein MPE1